MGVKVIAMLREEGLSPFGTDSFGYGGASAALLLASQNGVYG